MTCTKTRSKNYLFLNCRRKTKELSKKELSNVAPASTFLRQECSWSLPSTQSIRFFAIWYFSYSWKWWTPDLLSHKVAYNLNQFTFIWIIKKILDSNFFFQSWLLIHWWNAYFSKKNKNKNEISKIKTHDGGSVDVVRVALVEKGVEDHPVVVVRQLVRITVLLLVFSLKSQATLKSLKQ